MAKKAGTGGIKPATTTAAAKGNIKATAALLVTALVRAVATKKRTAKSPNGPSACKGSYSASTARAGHGEATSA